MRRRASFDSSCWRQTPAASNGARPQWRSHAVSTFDEQNWEVSVSAINLDNYAYPLTYRIKDPGLVSVWCTKQHSEQSFVRIEAAREIPPPSREMQFVRTTTRRLVSLITPMRQLCRQGHDHASPLCLAQ